MRRPMTLPVLDSLPHIAVEEELYTILIQIYKTPEILLQITQAPSVAPAAGDPVEQRDQGGHRGAGEPLAVSDLD